MEARHVSDSPAPPFVRILIQRPPFLSLKARLGVLSVYYISTCLRKAPRAVRRLWTSSSSSLLACMCCLLCWQCLQQHHRRDSPHGTRRGGGGAAHPQYANYWAPLTRKRHTMPHSAQSQHANYWAPRTRKRHQQEHRPQRPTESSDPTQHAKGRTGDRPGPRKGATTRRNVTQGAGAGGCCDALQRGQVAGGWGPGPIQRRILGP